MSTTYRSVAWNPTKRRYDQGNVFSSLALFLLPEGGRAALPRGIAAAAVLAFAYSIWARAGAGAETIYWGFLLLIAGLPVYVFLVRRSSA